MEYTVEKINTRVHLALFQMPTIWSQVNLMLASGRTAGYFPAYDVPQLTYIKRWDCSRYCKSILIMN